MGDKRPREEEDESFRSSSNSGESTRVNPSQSIANGTPNLSHHNVPVMANALGGSGHMDALYIGDLQWVRRSCARARDAV